MTDGKEKKKDPKMVKAAKKAWQKIRPLKKADARHENRVEKIHAAGFFTVLSVPEVDMDGNDG